MIELEHQGAERWLESEPCHACFSQQSVVQRLHVSQGSANVRSTQGVVV